MKVFKEITHYIHRPMTITNKSLCGKNKNTKPRGNNILYTCLSLNEKIPFKN